MTTTPPETAQGDQDLAAGGLGARAKTQIAIDRAHNQSRPTLLEIDTYRYYGHSVADSKHKGGYRTPEEIENYKQNHDPINVFRRRLINEGVLTDETAEAIKQKFGVAMLQKLLDEGWQFTLDANAPKDAQTA